jgi:hypothetical protein
VSEVGDALFAWMACWGWSCRRRGGGETKSTRYMYVGAGLDELSSACPSYAQLASKRALSRSFVLPFPVRRCQGPLPATPAPSVA